MSQSANEQANDVVLPERPHSTTIGGRQLLPHPASAFTKRLDELVELIRKQQDQLDGLHSWREKARVQIEELERQVESLQGEHW